jgi:histone-lysine N-methyltransferase SETMAR
MVTVVWDCEGMTLVDAMPSCEPVYFDAYIRTLTELRTRIRWVRPHKNPTEILLHHDNAWPHTSLSPRKANHKFCWTVLPHPPYITDPAPSDFHLFGALKDEIPGARFQNDDNTIRTVRTWLCQPDKAWCRQSARTHTRARTHTHICSSLAQGRRSGRRLWKKQDMESKISLNNP